jgi:hypothetical protein
MFTQIKILYLKLKVIHLNNIPRFVYRQIVSKKQWSLFRNIKFCRIKENNVQIM